MKKALLAMLVILTCATSSFAGVSFLTAPSVGDGHWAVLGMYATNHNGVIANGDTANTTAFDATSLGVRGEYGMMKSLDLLVAYSFDTLPNIKAIDDPLGTGKQTSGTTMGLGVKYSLENKLMGCDTAVLAGYESSNTGIKSDGTGKLSVTGTKISLGYVVSKQMGNLMPYGCVAYKMLTTSYGKSAIDDLSGTGLGLNIGCMIGIAANQAIAVEYNTENDLFGGVKKPQKNDDSAVNVSGISLGYVYMF